MKCEFCTENYKDEFLSKVRIDAGESVMLCNNCEEKLKYLVKEK